MCRDYSRNGVVLFGEAAKYRSLHRISQRAELTIQHALSIGLSVRVRRAFHACAKSLLSTSAEAYSKS
jgi:hypothetical protein